MTYQQFRDGIPRDRWCPRHGAASELAAVGCSDEVIQAVTGHQTRAMVAQYAGAARQRVRAIEGQEKRK